MRHSDAVEQVVGKVGSVVAWHLDVVEAEVALERIGRIKHQHAIVGAHPHIAVLVFGEGVDVVPVHDVAVLVEQRARGI